MRKLLLGCLLLAACQKDYENRPSPFEVGEQVKLNGIDPEKSFVPHSGGAAPLRIDSVYRDPMYPTFWFYNTHDKLGVKLQHVDNQQLKKY